MRRNNMAPITYKNAAAVGSDSFNSLAVSTTADSVALLCGLPTHFGGIILDTLYMYGSSLASVTQLTITIFRDASLDEVIVPTFTVGAGADDVGPIIAGVTTATDASVVVRLNIAIPKMEVDLSTLRIRVASDAGTMTLAKVFISGQLY